MDDKKAVKPKPDTSPKEHTPWIKHVLAVKAKNPKKSLTECMSMAKETYKAPA